MTHNPRSLGHLARAAALSLLSLLGLPAVAAASRAGGGMQIASGINAAADIITGPFGWGLIFACVASGAIMIATRPDEFRKTGEHLVIAGGFGGGLLLSAGDVVNSLFSTGALIQ